MSINTKKSCCIRIGRRFNKPCCCCLTTITGNAIAWSNSCKYLGVYRLAGRKFKCNFDEAKAKYYAFNGIMGKVGRSASQEVIIEQVHMKCLPIILYGTESCPLAKKDITSLEHILSCTFGKIFIVKQQEIIIECRKAFNLDNPNQIIKNRQLKFIAKLPVSNNIIFRLISSI